MAPCSGRKGGRARQQMKMHSPGLAAAPYREAQGGQLFGSPAARGFKVDQSLRRNRVSGRFQGRLKKSGLKGRVNEDQLHRARALPAQEPHTVAALDPHTAGLQAFL